MKKGEVVFIRTVTTYFIGRVRKITRSWVVLDDVVNVYETGPFDDFFGRGIVKTSERMPDGVEVARQIITDSTPWKHR